jgi:RNA-directed DNA polymerase
MHENRETSEISVIEADHRTAGEGQGRTARMHIFEESDSGVIPMNHSNKDGRLSAESEEGRPLQGEHSSTSHVPDTERGIACPWGWRVCGKQHGKIRRCGSLHSSTT